MIDFIKNFFMIDKNIARSNTLDQMDFEDRLNHYKNNDVKVNSEPRETTTFFFI
ncbi:hypothetical protein ACPWSR_03415 [Alloiococcus sp. CFN-8]|uniref:hypothetical protein n=1 Tax=Alloiococcus sp. CFN-8 TaxID=3416081 RepID=UPI003CF60BE5